MSEANKIYSMLSKFAMAVIVIGISLLAIALSKNDLAVVDALNSTDTAVFDISVATQAAIDINPNSTSWSSINPGNYTEPVDFRLENIGSVNITEIWADTTNPSSNPFGTDNPTAYDVGNFIQISNDSGSNYYFVDNLDFNGTRLPYATYPSSNVAQGRFRFGEQEYFWAVVNQTAPNIPGGCASSPAGGGGTSTTFYISSFPHNRTATGDTTLTDNSVVVQNNTAGTWGMGNLPAITGLTNSSSTTTGYCVAVNSACTQVRIFKYQKYIGSDPTDDTGRCTTDSGLYVATGTNAIAPGAGFNIKIRAAVPFGVSDGSLTTGTLTLKATSE